jgi:Uma2 family endonuclease
LAQFHDDHEDALLNPVLVIEVLSDSTAAYDKGKKFWAYQQIDSLQEYVLVEQDDFTVEVYRRATNGEWLYYHHISGLDKALALSTLECELSLSDIYDKVTLETPKNPFA